MAALVCLPPPQQTHHDEDDAAAAATPASEGASGGDDRFCELTLRRVLASLNTRDLLRGAARVSRAWHAAASCREVWRHRMHAPVLALFAPGGAVVAAADRGADKPPAAELCDVTPARLFSALHEASLLRNGRFLERLNSVKAAAADGEQGGAAAPVGARRLVWESSYNARGTTWAHPFDFAPELSPLPAGAGADYTAGAPAPTPFSVGCVAAVGPGWAEVVQVVDLRAALAAAGAPGALAPRLLAAGLPLEFSVFVASGPIAGGEYQLALLLVADDDAGAAAAAGVPLAAAPRMALPFGHPPPGGPSLDAVVAANLRGLGLRGGSRVASRAPLHPPPGVWTEVAVRASLPPGVALSHAVVALRGRPSRAAPRRGELATKFAAARLAFVPADRA